MASVVLEFLLAIVTVAAGAPIVGLVACAAMTICMVMAVVAEIVAFYRIGLQTPQDPAIGRNRGPSHRPGQAIW